MKPFRRFPRLFVLPAMLRGPTGSATEIPIERPPRTRAPRGRVHVVWNGAGTPPSLLEFEVSPSADGLRLQAWF